MYFKNKNIKTSIQSQDLLYGDMPRLITKYLYWQTVARYSLGNFLFGYCNWLINNLNSRNYKRIFFLSRDGWIMREATQVLCGESVSNRFSYLYVSRRSLVVPSLHTYSGYEEMANAMFWKKHFTLKEFIENFGLEYGIYEKRIPETVIISTVFEREDMFNNPILINIFNLFEKDIIENSIQEHKLLIEYFKQEQFSGKVAIIDCGWFGNLQHAIQRCIEYSDIEAEVDGYYIGIRQGCKYFDSQKMYGYLYCGKYGIENEKKEIKATAVVEAFFSHDEGSVKKYKLEKERVIPVLKELDLSNEQCKILNFIQKEAIRRVRYLYELSKKSDLDFTPYEYFKGFCRFALSPTLTDAWKIGKLVETRPIYGTIYYALRPFRIKRDIHNLNWKLGQLKRTIKVRLDYVKLYDLIDK